MYSARNAEEIQENVHLMEVVTRPSCKPRSPGLQVRKCKPAADVNPFDVHRRGAAHLTKKFLAC